MEKACAQNTQKIILILESRPMVVDCLKNQKERYYLWCRKPVKLQGIKLLFDKCLSASAVAKQLGVHVHAAQRWAKQYNNNTDSIFEKHRNIGRPRLHNEEHKKVILDCIDENPSVVLEQTMEQLRQTFIGLKVPKSTVKSQIVDSQDEDT
ncbi:hypothetical protein BCV72DRAFT_338371 [Rhizopus microsporus var. microsporus]|uniref:Uncharacterized protein n=1 Tax=Rhizopus microsporus var. microsporus TaxID=86635 RepID=A0A1X0QT08_RHIZD|nr:hypothetical protein BCV72DRAFT_338371 [Rhizopus microsporus var. microsporus]